MKSYLSLLRKAALISILSALSVSYAAEKAAPIPAPIKKAMTKYKVPTADFSMAVIPLSAKEKPVFINASAPRMPASVEKIVTSAAALELLGPAKVWHTRMVSQTEPNSAGVLKDDIYLIGSGNPELSLSDFRDMIEGLRSRGIQSIEGNIIVDRSRFDIPPHDPFAFDGEGNRPYNTGADAMLVNSRALFMQIRPDRKEGVAYLYSVPHLNGLALPKTIPLSKEACGAWRKQIKPDFSNPLAPKFLGSFPASCGNKDFFYTSLGADEYLTLLFSEFWKKAGGSWKGKLVSGKAPSSLKDMNILSSTSSEPLAKIIYDMNKHSLNPAARQLFLELGKTEAGEPKTLAQSRKTIKAWALENKLPADELSLDNGSGLSRKSRISAGALASVLAHMWNTPRMPEYMSSMPISGVDGTMRKRHAADGYAHIKTGYISGARSVAGYVQAKDGKRYAVAAIVNGPSALGSVPVLDAVISWVHSR